MRRGFTIAELLLVMVVLGVIVGISLGGLDRMDPGTRGFQKTMGTFLLSSRDRARVTGLPVVLSLDPETEERNARLQRWVYRPVREATFEVASRERENLFLVDPAILCQRGRVGAGLDLRLGGGVQVEGRAGVLASQQGLRLVFDVRPAEKSSGVLVDWKDLLQVKLRSDGSLQVFVMGGDGTRFSRQTVETASRTVVFGQWNHVAVMAQPAFDSKLPGILSIDLGGQRVTQSPFLGQLPEVEATPYLGDTNGRFRGEMDEFSVWVRTQEVGPVLPGDAELLMPVAEIHFDRFGRLDMNRHPQPIPVGIAQVGELQEEFLIGRFSQEGMP